MLRRSVSLITARTGGDVAPNETRFGRLEGLRSIRGSGHARSGGVRSARGRGRRRVSPTGDPVPRSSDRCRR